MFTKMIDRLRRHSFYVIADPADNSVTLSKALFKHMRVMDLPQAKVYVFFIPYGDDEGEYGFILNPEFDQETQLADIQYNGKYKTVGFESLNPTVGRIFYDYGLPHDCKVKLSVKVCRSANLMFYKICRPKR